MTLLALVATDRAVLIIDVEQGTTATARGIDDRPTCLAADPLVEGRAWCGTLRSGVFRSDDGGRSWRGAGLEGRSIMTVAPSPAERDLVWAGTAPSAVWRSINAGGRWEPTSALEALPSSSEWSFPPRPDTHHVRWMACHPHDPGRLWVAIEAGALVSTTDGGATWRDRVAGAPWDTHEIAIHRGAPETLRVAAGDGYFEGLDGGARWRASREGLEVGYLRSIAIDPGKPELVIVSAASGPRSAYVAQRSDGRLYRRLGEGPWERVRDGWPDPPGTIAPLLHAGRRAGELWAADERGLHRSEDGGTSWRRWRATRSQHTCAAWPCRPRHETAVSAD